MKVSGEIIALIILEILKTANNIAGSHPQITEADMNLEPFEATKQRIYAMLRARGVEIVNP